VEVGVGSGKVVSRAGDGTPLRVIGTHLDVTERKRSEEEIRKLALVAQNTDNAVIITDAEGCIEWVNDGFTRISGYTAAEVVGHKPGKVLQGHATDPAAVGRMREATRTRQGFDAEVLNYHKKRQTLLAAHHGATRVRRSGQRAALRSH
jgi:PAS domain S-box-containing protein